MAALRAGLVLSFVWEAQSHGAITFPRPRNALDGDLAPWTNWSYLLILIKRCKHPR